MPPSFELEGPTPRAIFPNKRSPRLQTLPSLSADGVSTRVSKRIIVCCDGTWQDGVVSKNRWQYSNILRLARMISYQDNRWTPAIPQIVFYQAGIGSEGNIYSEYIDGATGASLAEKVHEAYAFISHNYQHGDEIFLFGFSRGAYTARMTAAFIGEIGILDRKDMDHFATIFEAYQKRENKNDKKEIAKSKELLEPFTNSNAKGRRRADPDGDKFTIKCLGVFDTVGSIGLPEEFRLSREVKHMFGFPDKFLGGHIENAFQAMALNETRADFTVAKFHQRQKGRERGQVLKQAWFTGSHSDIGGGYKYHDLADITLTWMASNIECMLSLDLDYLKSIPRPIAPWGAQKPHDPKTGIFKLAHFLRRIVPTQTDDITHECIHPSVMSQDVRPPELDAILKKNPSLLCTLAPLEEEIKQLWPYVPSQVVPPEENVMEESASPTATKKTLLGRARTVISVRRLSLRGGGRNPPYEKTWLEAFIQDLRIGP